METNFEEIILKGALILDVRTKEEYIQGHIEGSLNIPLEEISNATSWMIKDIPVILVCASGGRSEVAQRILQENGYREVYNGGAWDNLGNINAGGCPIK